MSTPAALSLVVTLAVVGGVLVVVLRCWSRRSAAVQAGADLRSLFERDVAPSGVDWSTYEAVALAVSDAYGVHPGWLQPHDLLDKLFGLDSWDLGTGTEQLEALIAEQFGAVAFPKPPRTLLDLLLVVQNATQASASLAFELAVLERMDPAYRACLLREIGLTSDRAHLLAARSPIRLPEQTDSSIDVYRAALGPEVLILDSVRHGPAPGDASVPHCFVLPLWPHLFWVVEQLPDGQTWNVGFRNQIELSSLHFTPATVRPGVWTRSALESLAKSVEWGDGWDETSTMRFTIGHQRYEGVFTYGLLTAWRCLTP